MRKRPTDTDRREAIRVALNGFARGADLPAVLRELHPLHPPHDIFPGGDLLELAADALEEASASRQNPVDYHQIRERYLPEVEFFSRSDHLKSHYALRAVAMIHGGVTPDLLDEASWWRGDDLWIFATYAVLAYLRMAAARTGEPIAHLCGRLAARKSIELESTPA
jgi:hypothetical protein